jgi:cytochrome bd ubiquinol oxidase subunit I
LMIFMWILMVFFAVLSICLWRKGTLFTNKWVLRGLVFSVFFPQIANQAGWVSAEMGRYPWIVYHLLRISDGLSKSVTANQVFGSLVMFTIVYFMLFLVFIYLLNEKIKHGPEDGKEVTPYKNLNKVGEHL